MAFSRSAVIDIGSNSVRMVIFDVGDRSLSPVFNEKAMSGLGRNLLTTGRLDPDGRESALSILHRFRLIADSMGVGRIRPVATAASRDAEDGPAFIVAAEKVIGAQIDVISGEKEARLSALGVLCGIPEADGLIGDLGGGSLDIADVSMGAVGGAWTLPLGPLALGDVVGGRKEKARIRAGLAHIPSASARGRTLYVVGGAWRNLAKHHFEIGKPPIRIIHQYSLSRMEAERLLRRVGRVKADGLDKLKGISSRRRAMAPYAARLLGAFIARAEPEEIVFSAYGLREGVEFEAMTPLERGRDPLLDHCRKIGQDSARVAFDGARLAHWALDAFEAPPVSTRLIEAAGWLSDMAGLEHPDYRAHYASGRALHLSTAALEHWERAFLAATVYARYSGFGMEAALGPAADLLTDRLKKAATAFGMALRLAHAIEPGDTQISGFGVRSRFRLERSGGRLLLVANGLDEDALGETPLKRFHSLARALELEPVTIPDQSAAA